jgi:hypothetical protein
MPPFIPVLEAGLPEGLVLPPGHLYGVGLRTILSTSGRIKVRSPQHLRETLQLPLDARLCLICSCDDQRIESIWRRSLELDSWRDLASLHFEFVTGMTFSVWPDNPRFTQCYNIERNYASIDYFAGLGVPVVPIFFCARDLDFRRAGRWFRDRPALRAIGGLAQFHKSGEAFRDFLDGMARIRIEARRDLHLFAIGCATRERIGEVFRVFPNAATIVTNKPIRKGTSGHGFEEDLSSGKHDGKSRQEIIPESLVLYRRICQGYREGSLLLDLATVNVDGAEDSRQMELFAGTVLGRG